MQALEARQIISGFEMYGASKIIRIKKSSARDHGTERTGPNELYCCSSELNVSSSEQCVEDLFVQDFSMSLQVYSVRCPDERVVVRSVVCFKSTCINESLVFVQCVVCLCACFSSLYMCTLHEIFAQGCRILNAYAYVLAVFAPVQCIASLHICVNQDSECLYTAW